MMNDHSPPPPHITHAAGLDSTHEDGPDGEEEHDGVHDAARLRHPTHEISTTSTNTITSINRGRGDERSRRRLRGGSSSLSSSPGPHLHSRSRSRHAGSRASRAAATTAADKPIGTDIRILFMLVALVSLAWSLYQLPLNRVIERRLCVEYYRHHDASVSSSSSSSSGVELAFSHDDGEIPEEMCKVDRVQQDLGRIQGFMETGWVVGDFVMTIPLIAIADRYGHGLVLLLNLVPRLVLLGWTFAVGYFDSILPVNAIIVAPLFSVLGGDCVFNSIVYSLVSGSTDDVVLRATYFGQMNAISSIFAYQLGPALASASMSVLLWLPLWFGIILLLLAIPVVSLLNLGGSRITNLFNGKSNNMKRQGQGHKRRESNELEEGSPLLSSSSPSTTTTSHTNTKKSGQGELVGSIRSRFGAIVKVVTTYPRNFTLLLTGFFLTSLASSDTKLLTQYISKRYHWKFTSVGYLLSAKAVFNFFLLYFIIPALLSWRERGRARARSSSFSQPQPVLTDPDPEGQDHDRDPHEQRETDRSTVTHAHVCLVFSVLGALAIGSSSTIYLLIPSLLLYALGIALPMFTYSLLKSPAMLPPASLTHVSNQTRQRHVRGRGNESETDDETGAGAEEDTGSPASSSSSVHRSSSESASTAQIFSIVMLVKTSGMLVGAPLMASLWVYGVGVGGAGLGFPYFVSAACYGLVIFIFCKIRV